MEKVLNFQTDLKKVFRAYVELLQPVLKLQKRNADVFAEILYLNYVKRNIPYEDRFDLIFSTSYKKIIKENLNITDAILQNSLSSLRKINLIVDNCVPEKYLIYPKDNKISVKYNISINEDKV
jgi:hypothetical protein